jgi:hypothetical protein
MHKTEAAWTLMVTGVLREQARILCPWVHLAFEAEKVRKGGVLLEGLDWRAAEDRVILCRMPMGG